MYPTWCLMSPISCLMSLISCLMSPISCLMFYVSCFTSLYLISCVTSQLHTQPLSYNISTTKHGINMPWTFSAWNSLPLKLRYFLWRAAVPRKLPCRPAQSKTPLPPRWVRRRPRPFQHLSNPADLRLFTLATSGWRRKKVNHRLFDLDLDCYLIIQPFIFSNHLHCLLLWFSIN